METVARAAQPTDWPAALDRLAGGTPRRSAEEVLRDVDVSHFVLEDFRPLAESLGWRLAELFWAQAGLQPFIENEVPFVVTSNGRLSEDAAAVFLANGVDAPAEGPLVVVELGAGTGLFARYFLDAVRALSAQQGTDVYERLLYVVSDRSPRTVEQWAEARLFDDHGPHVVRAVCDAVRPGELRAVDGAHLPIAPLRAVICNYSLDVLPAAVVRRGPQGYEELVVRTSLIDDPSLVAQYTRLAPTEIRALATSDDRARCTELIPLASLLQLEAAFVARNGATPPYAADALAVVPEASRAVVNHGAVQCVEGCLSLLDDDGFLLINDYGPVRPDQVADNALAQRFGRTTALGINFPFLDRVLERRGCTVLRPEGDEEWPIHARLICRRELPHTAATFHARFALDAYRAGEEPLGTARAHRAAGRNDQALADYRAALERRPRDWHLLGEVAEFVGLHLRDFASGAELARIAVELNPWYSSWLWNVLGDCLFCLERYEPAHEAYSHAHRIHPRDARTNLNLAYTLFQFGSLPEALNAVAAALAHDVGGQYRETLLQKQQQILVAIAARRLAEQDRLTRSLPTAP